MYVGTYASSAIYASMCMHICSHMYTYKHYSSAWLLVLSLIACFSYQSGDDDNDDEYCCCCCCCFYYHCPEQ